MRFWRERERESKEQILAPLCGQVRVLVVGDSGVGKTSLVQLINNGSSIQRSSQTIGCTVGVKVVLQVAFKETQRETSLSSSGMYQVTKDTKTAAHSSIPKSTGLYLFMISLREELKQACRNGRLRLQRQELSQLHFPQEEVQVVFLFRTLLLVTKQILLQRKERKEAVGTLLMQLVIGLRSKVCFLQAKIFLSLKAFLAAKETRYDKEALNKFFRMLIRRRYFSDELPSSSPWSIPTSSSQRLDEITSDEDQFYKRTSTKEPNFTASYTLSTAAAASVYS
ncbi:PREDICTED: uncharacterized protein LOC106313026 isoform X2 [Brassica oleracea var. oleracea]|uniref:uncharacterized protein LOC106313026 isoform X2 n=1 Tax=Brassica oleracea var. oleracea TaxID=109376 RepID=UPI0006A6BB98|nr:PREDICTED: uncharacterized protein LOC106313026 isoform X2 [Brassica oleracea var. oleracea]